jgi:hypothetical protein
MITQEQIAQVNKLREGGMGAAKACEQVGMSMSGYGYHQYGKKKRLPEPQKKRGRKPKLITFEEPATSMGNITLSGTPEEIGILITTLARGMR